MIILSELASINEFSALKSSFDRDSIIYLFDMIGIIACSVSGTILARSKNFDPMGCILVAMVNAIGGGTARDIMLGRHPLFWTVDMNYLIVITITSLIFQGFFKPTERIDRLLRLSDSIGLAAFTLIGIKVATSYGANPAIATLMGIVTILVGGMIRDMICNEIPLVLRHEIYITASMVGAVVYFALQNSAMNSWFIEILTMVTVFAVRMLAIRYNWSLPPVNTWFSWLGKRKSSN